MNGISKKAHIAAIGIGTIAALAQGDTTQLKLIAIGCVTVMCTLTVLLQSFLDRNNHKGELKNGKVKTKPDTKTKEVTA